MAFKRSRAGFKVPLAVLMRLTVLIFLVSGLVEAQRSSIAGQWWASRWFWAALATLVAATAGVAWRARGHGYVLRARVLEAAVIERTADLDKERRRERESNKLLEMLVANEPLGTVLEAVLRSVGQDCPDALCAILLKRGDGCQVAAAVDLPGDWLTALQVPCAVPFEVWRMPVSNQNMLRAPPWRIFASHLESAGPVAVYSRPILQAESQSAAIVLFYRNGIRAEESDARAAETGARMAGLAIEQSRLYDGLHFQANHDSLTGLANRAAFEDRLDRSLREAEVLGQRLAVLFIDLDRFKAVNDAFSHRVGDLFLREVAGRIEKTVRPGDMVARIGGDEFTVVVNDVKDTVEVSEIAARMLDAIRQPLVIDGHEIEASASVGIAVFPDDGTDAETLQRAADAAMYCAKDHGSDRAQTFAARNETLDRVRMDETLRVALREGYFVVHYQPKVGIDRKLAGLEALVRMNHPAHGRIPPMSFIPVAESTGLIVPLGAWVLDEACRQIAAWELRGLNAVSVAVNVSPVQIRRADFAKSVEDCLARHGVAASSLELELTESFLINAAGVTQEQLGALRNIGVKLSIDDFGTGYSSLSYLHRLPVDAIKLDKSFVQSIDTDPLAHRLVHAMVDVGTGLGLSVVAEGVETEGQRDALLAAGCSLMQGFLFSRPKPACEVEEFLRTGHEAPEIPNTPLGTTDDLLQMAASVHAASDLVGEPVSA
jgi:diguanylate cyclase (GGDEF)-like protein